MDVTAAQPGNFRRKIKPSSRAFLLHFWGLESPMCFPDQHPWVWARYLRLGPLPEFRSCGKRAVPRVAPNWHPYPRHIPGVRRVVLGLFIPAQTQGGVCHPATPQIWFLDWLSSGYRGCSSTVCLPSAVLVNTF